MIVYLSIVILVLTLHILKFNKNKGLIIIFICLFLVSAFRNYSVGVDTIQYYQYYTIIGNYSGWDYSHFRYEPGFFYLCKVLFIITSEPQMLLIITSAFINFSVYYFIRKNSENYYLSALIYIIFNIYFSTMNTMREWLAISFILLAFSFLVNRKYLVFSLFILFAVCFHNAAWASLLLLPAAIFRKKKVLYLLLVIGAFIIFIFYASFYEYISKLFGYSDYNEKFTTSNYYGALLVFVESFVILLVIYLYLFLNGCFTSIIENEKSSLLLSCSIIYLCFLAAVMRVNLFNRISGFFEIFIIITIPNLLTKVNNYRDRIILESIAIVIMLISFFVIGYSRPEWLGCIPYQLFIN